MKKFLFLAALTAAVFGPAGAAFAQTPTPAPTDENFLTDQEQSEDSPFIGAGGLPGPYEIPPPPEGSEEITNELWEYDNLAGMVSMFQSVFLLANQNLVISAFLVIGGVVVAFIWVIDLVRRRQDNI